TSTLTGPWGGGPMGGSTSYAYNGMIFGIAYQWGWGMQTQRFPSFIADGTSNTIFITEREVQSYGASYWTPDGGFNYWPDWGPVIGSVECGCPGNIETGPAILFQVRPKQNCVSVFYGVTAGCGFGD